MKNIILFFLVPSVFWGCNNSTKINLEYSVKIPPDIPETMTFHPKHEKPYTENAHAIYKDAHKRGWEECIDDFKSGNLKNDSKPIIKQQFGLEQDAELDGYNQCKEKIFILIKKHGENAVRNSIK